MIFQFGQWFGQYFFRPRANAAYDLYKLMVIVIIQFGFVQSIQEQMKLHGQEPVSFHDVKDEIFDMVKPLDPLKLTLQDLIRRYLLPIQIKLIQIYPDSMFVSFCINHLRFCPVVELSTVLFQF